MSVYMFGLLVYSMGTRFDNSLTIAIEETTACKEADKLCVKYTMKASPANHQSKRFMCLVCV